MLLFAVLIAMKAWPQMVNRVPAVIDPHPTAALKGFVRPEARAEHDAGPLEAGRGISGIIVGLKPSPEQQAAIEKLLIDQQDASSPDYHRWLTPQEYADRFGLSAVDVDRIGAWLKDGGLSIDYVAQGRNWIVCSGTVEHVQKTFHTEIRQYRVDGEVHYANATEPSVPADLAPVIGGFMGLNDFHLKPPARRFLGPSVILKPSQNQPDGSHTLAPGDLWTIYDINPMYAKGIDGTGQKIVIAGQTRINMSDVTTFRSQFGLPSNNPQTILVSGSADPGITGDLDEADLDLEWAGAIAPKATVLYVFSTDVFTSVGYAISQNLAPIISLSYGGCEQKVSGTTAANADLIRSWAQQANLQGITWLASSGDSGAAACDQGSKVATSGLAVNLPASVPEVTAVGGTEFNEGNGTYWSSKNGANGSSALSYIPERVWNDSPLTGEPSGGGGGKSIFFSKPAWQTGPGVPNDGMRDIPDISFTAAFGNDAYNVVTGGKTMQVGGTSASCPVFAGMLSLLNQYLVANGVQSKPGLGNINANLYSLAQSTPGIFHDVTVGNNAVPCTKGTPDCSTGTEGYSAGAGYDLATGLGSTDATNLITQWTGHATVPSTTSVSANPASIPVTSSTNITATVKAASGTTTPSGSVDFSSGKTSLGSAALSGSGGTATASISVAGNKLVTGSNNITAAYGGTNNFSASTANVAVTVTVPTTTSAPIPTISPNPVYQQQTDTDGYSWFFTVTIKEIAGVATTLTGFSINTTDYSSNIVSWFGTSTLPANGTLSAHLRSKISSVPATWTFKFTGADASNATWTQQVSVPFYGPQLTAALALTSSPSTEVLNPAGDPNCDANYPYYQELNLQEKNGYEVHLTKFLAGGFDESDKIEYWFSSWRLAPLGSLQAFICWSVDAPATLQYEIDGIDSQGNKISTTLSVPFQGPAKSPGSLSVSKTEVDVTLSPNQTNNTALTVNLPAGQQWSVSIFPANQKTAWLMVAPQSGTGTSSVKLTISSVGLANGAYPAMLVFQSVNTIPQFVDVPVNLTVATKRTNMSGQVLASPVITGVSNGASFQSDVAAPGMILSVFGKNLSDSPTALFASTLPLPASLGGTSATINGIAAPFYYASANQLNIQVPYETPEGTAVLAVNNNGDIANFVLNNVSTAAPGIFTFADGTLVPVATASRGKTITLFMTGEGDVLPYIDTGQSPPDTTPLNQLPAPRHTLSLTVGGVTAKTAFVGIPYYLVGITQINFIVPTNSPLGLQPVVITVDDNNSIAAKLNVTP
jgi:uncharacterized protein (TIGR03437 family)